MSVYEYVALDEKGRERKGFVDATGVSAARQQLRESGIYPVEIYPAREKNNRLFSNAMEISFLQKISSQEVSMFTRQLSTLLGAGIPLVPSFSVLLAQTKNPLLQKTLAQIRADLTEGKSLTASMENYPNVFPLFYINMVKAGEASGTIDLVLERLADFSENQQELRNKIRSALAYPMIMLLVGSLVIFLLMTFVVPRITEIFFGHEADSAPDYDHPDQNQQFLKSFWWLIILAAILGVFAFKYATGGTEAGRRYWDAFRLKAPVWGAVNLKIAIARFTRTLATLLQSGVPLLAAMEIVRNVVNNVYIGEAIGTVGKEVEEGKSLAAPLAASGLFPPMVTEMIAVGEQTGSLETMLNRIAASYETEAQSDIMVMTSLLEPVMILVMGLIVGFIVFSILLPIFEMNQMVK